ncbi:LegC family aminotransferase [uncultured Dokdonia sp.]|uniref:LegC family aminotransferase n=1 Tax=uncultured Dokdonia sp. TaxID=575653 RepID=UPI002621B8BB|nr:LegC family aminotransferase [uncultured Dokdonia sp.]
MDEKFIDFIQENFKSKDFIPLHPPVFIGNEKIYLNDCIDSTFVSSVGPYVNRFEEEFAEFTQTKKATAVVNGTSALHVSLRLSGVSAGDEVITQALTFVATTNAIVYAGAAPVFVDVDRDTMGLSPVALKSFLEEFAEVKPTGTFNKFSGKRIAACMPMHTFGFMCRIDEIVNICNLYNIPVVEDAAESLGSSYKGKSSGSFGLVSGFSFNGNKIITAGGGGAIVSNDIELSQKAKHLTTTAKEPHPWEYVHNELGYNYRMPNINAALVCAQLEKFQEILTKKRNLYDVYKNNLVDFGLQIVEIPEDTKWNYWLMSVLLDNKKERDEFLKFTNSKGVMTRPIWQLMFKLPMYENCQRDKQENALFLEERIVNIPSGVIL